MEKMLKCLNVRNPSMIKNLRKIVQRSSMLFLCFAILSASMIVFNSSITAVAAGNTYYVSTTGSDSNSGTLSQPFLTINHAAQVAQAGDTVIIRGGTYRETVTPANSGTSTAPITYESYPGEKATINGCNLITGWTSYSGSIYQAPMNWTMGTGRDEVFVDGNVLVQARYPNVNSSGKVAYPSSVTSPLWPVKGDFTSVYQSSPIQVTSSSLLNQADNYWQGAIYDGGHGWMWCWQSGLVSSSTNGALTITQPSGQWWFNLSGYNYCTYNQQGEITNSMNCLTYAGGWQNQNNKLYLWTTDSSNPSSHVVEAKARNLAFNLSNTNYINIVGINIFACSITMYHANNCTINGCNMSYISHFLLWDDSRDGYIDNYTQQTSSGAPQLGEVGIYVGGNYDVVENSTIAYSSGAGLILAGLDTTVTNNNIHDCGYASTYLGGIFITFDPTAGLNSERGGHVITYNNIYNIGRSAIDWSSEYLQYPGQQTPYDGSTIAYNQIHDACLLGQDGGAIYSWTVSLNANGIRTQVYNNLIYNVWGQEWCALCYADNYTYGIDYHDNVLWQEPFSARNSRLGDGFTGGNSPNDATFTNNTKLDNYIGGVSGLTLSNYPNCTYFVTGSNHNDDGSAKTIQPPLTTSAFVSSDSLGTLNNNINGWVGMEVTVGSIPLKVTSLGRVYVTGNTGIHTTKITNASTGIDVTNGSVSVPTTGGVNGQFVYANLATPVTLAPNTSYYISSQETNGGDQWYDVANTTVSTTTDAVCNCGASYTSSWTTSTSTGHTYGPVNFIYEIQPIPTIANPGFESGWTGWSNWDSYASIDTTHAHSGSDCVKVVGNSTTWSAAYQTITGLQPNSTYTISAWGEYGGGTIEGKLGVMGYGGNEVDTYISGTGYHQYSVTFTTGPSNTTADIQGGISSSSSLDYCYWDDFTLSKSLITNPGFESGWTGWSNWDSYASIDTTHAHSESNCVMVVGNSNTWSAAYQHITGLQPNTTYTLTAWGEYGGGTIEGKLAAWDYGGNEVDTYMSGTGYHQYSVTFTTGPSNTTADIQGGISSSSSLDYCYWDDFTLYKI
jgi:hypothetical protein